MPPLDSRFLVFYVVKNKKLVRPRPRPGSSQQSPRRQMDLRGLLLRGGEGDRGQEGRRGIRNRERGREKRRGRGEGKGKGKGRGGKCRGGEGRTKEDEGGEEREERLPPLEWRSGYAPGAD